MASPPRLRWGIASTGRISSDFVNALQHDGGVAGAVAARSLEDAQAFAAKFGIERSYGDYQALAGDPGVDVVYVGSINTSHAPIVRKMLAEGKPVLCEKPLCVSLAETEELVELARARGVFLMEAVWSRFTPLYTELRQRVEAGEIGDVRHVVASFGKPTGHVERLRRYELGGGCVFDIGIYALNVMEWLMGAPQTVCAVGKVNEEGCDSEVSACLQFPGNRFGSLCLSTSSKLPNEATIVGTKGTIKLPEPFHTPLRMETPSGDVTATLDPSERKFNFRNSQALKYQAREVEACLRGGLKESTVMPLETSLVLARAMDKIRCDVGARPH